MLCGWGGVLMVRKWDWLGVAGGGGRGRGGGGMQSNGLGKGHDRRHGQTKGEPLVQITEIG